MKGRAERERQTQLNAKFQRIASRDKKAFLRKWREEIEENNRVGNTRDLFKKTRHSKGTFHAKMGTKKDRNGKDLTEAEETKNCCTVSLIPHATKVMPKIFQSRFQQYVN